MSGCEDCVQLLRLRTGRERGKTRKIIFKLRVFSFIYLPSIHPSLTSKLAFKVRTDAKANTAVSQQLKSNAYKESTRSNFKTKNIKKRNKFRTIKSLSRIQITQIRQQQKILAGNLCPRLLSRFPI